VRFDAVLSSPLQRALRTAELAGFEDPQVTSLLSEVDYGEYEGLTLAEIHQRDPDWELYRDGCPGGETPQQIAARAAQFIAFAAGLHKTRVIAFAHGHILRAVAATWIEANLTVAARLQLDSATVSILLDGDRGRVIRLWNAG
jgi:broad specificity phosphatase PhoE